MAIDRDAVLKQAEKLLRQGKLDGAIEAYERLIEEQPGDWNSLNALGDLYARAGQPDRAAQQYTHIADNLFGEGFLPKASALYKKALKTRAADEHAVLRLAEIAARQGLFADARVYLRQLAKHRRDRGDERGALDCLVRLGSLEDADPPSQAAGGRAAQALDDTAVAVQLYKNAAAGFEKAERNTEALDAMAEAVRLAPADHALRGQLARSCIALGQFERARAFLSRQAAGDDPDLLLMVGRIDLTGGRQQDARVALTRLLTIAPDRRPAVSQLAEEMADAGLADAAYCCVELVVDDAVLAGDWSTAIAALQAFVARTPRIPALIKLVEITVDAGDVAAMRAAQASLADAYIDAGRAGEARIIAEDLVASEPSSQAHVHRLRRTLDLVGASDADKIIARYREPVESVEDIDLSMGEAPATAEPLTDEVLPEEDLARLDPEPQGADVPVMTLDMPVDEIDLNAALASLTGLGESTEPEPAPIRDAVFEGTHDQVSRDEQVAGALDQFDRGVSHLEGGREAEAIADLEGAARMPILRFAAATRLGRIFLNRGEMEPGIEWLERAAEVPSSNPDEVVAVLYELAAALQAIGEGARALAVLIEIDAGTAAYRDVPQRIEQLKTAGEIL